MTIEATLNAWAQNLGKDRKAIAIRLTKSGIQTKQRYTAKEIFDAMHTSRDAALTRKAELQAKLLEQRLGPDATETPEKRLGCAQGACSLCSLYQQLTAELHPIYNALALRADAPELKALPAPPAEPTTPQPLQE